tara:strand:- start:356 stop:727 length:372 start_codon:yes stop_codon:yes gene_type:complete
MREIKFRAWDKKKEKLIYQNEMDHLIFPGKRKVENFEDIELMQYTGLKDENGKEIYEGDVVSGFQVAGMADENYVVEFMYASFVFKRGDTGLRLGPGPEMFTLHNHEIEVIGNIHENPELLSS